MLFLLQEFIVKLDDESATVTNYTGGEATGSSWTDKVMSFKGQQETPQEELGHGAADDEWVSGHLPSTKGRNHTETNQSDCQHALYWGIRCNKCKERKQ